MSTHRKTVSVKNKLGLHARPAAELVQLTSTFHSEIFVEKDNHKVNAKSIMGLMMLAAGYGTKLCFTAQGQDAEEALVKVKALFDAKFYEEDDEK